MTVRVIGLGRVGFPTAPSLATPHDVACVDVDEGPVATPDRSDLPSDESGLTALAHPAELARRTADVSDSFDMTGGPTRGESARP